MFAYILHSRPYKESSALLDLFSAEGRWRGVLRNARGRSGSVARPFALLDVELRGRSELKTLSRLEAEGLPHNLSGERLFSGFYLNELLLRLLPVEDAQPVLFEQYAATLVGMADGGPLEPLLRGFEWRLLAELGYAFALDRDTQDRPIVSSGSYHFRPDQGFERLDSSAVGAFSGAQLLALGAADWQVAGALATAKRLMRQALAPHLGDRPLASRALFGKRRDTPESG